MLFKSKSFGSNVQSLFQLDEDSDTDSKKQKGVVDGENLGDTTGDLTLSKLKIKDEVDAMEDGELDDVAIKQSPSSNESSVPSPFQSRKTFRERRKYFLSRKLRRSKQTVKIESGASDISSSEDELLAKGSYSPPLPKLKIEANDQMSLSSLSSTEPIKEEVGLDTYSPSASANYPVAFSTHNAAYYYQNSLHHFQQPSHWNDPSIYKSQRKKETSDDPHEKAIKKVIDKLILELKQILKKDFNKRMIENTAFKKYESWWDDQERSKITRLHHDTEEPSKPLPAPLEPTITENYQRSGSLGILRNLRFQRIKREPVVLPQEEDSRRSDQDDDDMVHGSDSEKENVQQTSKTSYINRNVLPSSSSESSSEDSSSSDDDDEAEDKDAHVYSSDTASIESGVDDLSLQKPIAKKEKEDNRIYSDSESDIEVQRPSTSSQVKQKIYSDSEEDELPTPDEPVEDTKRLEPSHPVESDSEFFNDDVISKPPRTPGRVSSDDQVVKEPVLQIKEKEKVKAKEEERKYSDSEEERDYQEKIRRNTEWMEQIEREKLLQPKEELTSSDTSRAQSPVKEQPSSNPATESSFIDSIQDRSSLPPATPGANIQLNPFTSKLDQDLGKKKRGRPKGSVGKPKEPKKVKNGAVSKNEFFAPPHPSSKPEADQKYSLRLSPFSSSDGGSSHASLVALEHCYSRPPSASPSLSSSPHDHQDIHMDHDYCGKADANPLQSIQPRQIEEQHKKETGGARPVGRPKKDPNAPKAQYTKKEKNQIPEKQKAIKEKTVKFDYKQHQSMVQNFVPTERYSKRTNNEEYDNLCRFVTQGIDHEDVDYMQKAYSYLIQNDIPGTEILHSVHWVPHCATDLSFVPPPPKKRRKDNEHVMKQHERCDDKNLVSKFVTLNVFFFHF